MFGFFNPMYVVFMLSLLVFTAGCSQEVSEKSKETQYFDAVESSQQEVKAYWRRVKELYEKAKEAGEQVPEDVVEWVKQDIRKIGTWEYKIVLIDDTNAREVENTLNKLGAERWECFWVEEGKGGKRFYLKKVRRSYLRTVPTGEILKLIPLDGSGG